MKRIIIYLLAFLPLHLFAGDYVDDINTATNNEVGHQVIYEMNIGSFTQAGTFTAAQQRLDELKTLGVAVPMNSTWRCGSIGCPTIRRPMPTG